MNPNSGFKQRDDGCFADRSSFISNLNPEDYFNDDVIEEDPNFDDSLNIVKKEWVWDILLFELL